MYGAVAQMGERHTCTVDVAGSIPVSSTCQSSSVWLEQVLCKHQVVGSNPISGSRVSYNGNTSAFQADAVGSIPSTRSIINDIGVK